MKETFYLNYIIKKRQRKKWAIIQDHDDKKEAIKDLITNEKDDDSYCHGYDIDNKGKIRIIPGYQYTMKLTIDGDKFTAEKIDLMPDIKEKMKTIRQENIEWNIKCNKDQAQLFLDKNKKYEKLLKKK